MFAHSGVLLVLLVSLTATVSASTSGDGKCLRCHGQQGSNSQSNRRNYIDPARYAATSHSIIGCTSCHDKVSANHPQDGSTPFRATCGECHDPVNREYSRSIHAAKARCNDCHNPHEVRLPLFMSGDEINSKCARCHDTRKTIQTHAKWLPQAELHIDSLLCITCHTGSRDYVITMSIESRQPGSGRDFKTSTYAELARLSSSADITRVIDLNGDGRVSLAELRQFNHHLRSKSMRLTGVMIPEVVTHSYQILENRWDCSFCHASGSRAMQKSFIVFPEKGGGHRRLAVEQGAILDILYGTPDFYMLGTTRSTPLNIVGALIVASGLAFPLGHGFFRFLTRKNRKEDSDHEA